MYIYIYIYIYLVWRLAIPSPPSLRGSVHKQDESLSSNTSSHSNMSSYNASKTQLKLTFH